MSKPVQEYEISALIDGELEPARAAEVHAAIERDPALQRQFAHLAEAHRDWLSQARSAQFQPRLPRLGAQPSEGALARMMTGLAVVLTAGRCLTKPATLDFGIGLLIHALLLAVVIAAVVWIGTRATTQPRPAPAMASDRRNG